MHSKATDGMANSVNLDQTAQEQSDQGLHCLLRPTVPVPRISTILSCFMFCFKSYIIIQIPAELTRLNFTGCMGGMYIDAQPLGLYNFEKSAQENCMGCLEV